MTWCRCLPLPGTAGRVLGPGRAPRSFCLSIPLQTRSENVPHKIKSKDETLRVGLGTTPCRCCAFLGAVWGLCSLCPQVTTPLCAPCTLRSRGAEQTAAVTPPGAIQTRALLSKHSSQSQVPGFLHRSPSLLAEGRERGRHQRLPGGGWGSKAGSRAAGDFPHPTQTAPFPGALR